MAVMMKKMNGEAIMVIVRVRMMVIVRVRIMVIVRVRVVVMLLTIASPRFRCADKNKQPQYNGHSSFLLYFY